MNEPEDPSRDRLKHHFAQRVTHQARQILEVWQRLQQSEWSAADMAELAESTLRLMRFAERFEQFEHVQLARSISLALAAVEANRGRLSSGLITELNQLMQRLSRTGLRHGDRLEQTSLPPLRKPIYVMLQEHERADRLAKQLEFFGLSAVALENTALFHASMAERHPAAIVMDVDFGGAGQGLKLAAQVQEGLELKLPLLFFSQLETDTPTRLAAVRAGGQEFLTGTLEASSLLEKIEVLTCVAQYEPYKVLIIDDSRAQATHTERLLNSAGIVTRTLLDPIQAMAELADFQPDLIILDMYMPGCTGPELAKVIRHNDRYVSVPIIYLSAEDDLDKQLDAMSEGGDDFLTKPIKPRHLITTVRNRAARARNLKSRMVRDSLTGLYNHTHILQLLEDCSFRSRRESKPLSFAMLDIDHFKRVNDTHGHPMGDRVIKSLALFLKQRLRKTDYIGRYGGEEFAVVMPDTDLHNAHRVLDEIRQRFAEIHYPAQPVDLCCTFSAGVVELCDGADSLMLATLADDALYRAKDAGRNQVHAGHLKPNASFLEELADAVIAQ
ncbi:MULTISPECIES: PleD family two-component system response regulator [unclassified Pseudomonas]|uniref:PleD family two-component system response regulator n=1 Tax=unclassified Pseudomonas TaxID=196821 RepID=UPI002AC8DAE0|nr:MULTISPECIES: PleD family two-component system response regulator [unclassified Pseudomonas]MEB0041653.1 PleD family two-component system response regulator [Pseudomonas sp. MH10]MEB0079932.1 PleD family two-component system response regulator [Pseudomonas sp. MH10out]MEB0093358.1 PleD family two-component system response regulator [Pseudomonas sp. CCI4.2]MEB0104141.1 PleD family two-component system response regulator [Pseudomonas sp. CCI3.2]MEB0121971.1 PleD family two-component system re